MGHLKTPIALATVLVLASCALVSRFHVNVSTIAEAKGLQPIASKSYVLLSGTADISPEDLQFKEFAGYLHRALAAQGYHVAEDPAKADVVIFLRYGIGDPQAHAYSYSVPVYGQTGGGTGTYSGSTYGSGGYSHTSGSINVQPTYGVVGSRSYSGTYTTFFRWIIMDAFDLQALLSTETTRQVWNTTITSTGSSGDLRRLFPVMIGGAAPHIGRDTGKEVRLVLTEGDARVKAVIATE